MRLIDPDIPESELVNTVGKVSSLNRIGMKGNGRLARIAPCYKVGKFVILPVKIDMAIKIK
jgi:hypothetical protein